MPTVRQLKFWDSMLVPASRLIDPVFAYRMGKSIVAIWTC